MTWITSKSSLCRLRRLAARLSARLDPVRAAAHPAAGLGDVREIGSGNIGATNVLRTGRKGLAAATLILDAAKGAAAVLLAGLVWPDAGRRASRRSAPFSAISIRSGCASRAARASRPLLGIVAGSALAGALAIAAAVWLLALVADPLFLGRRHGRGDRRAGRRRLLRPDRPRHPVSPASPCSSSGSTAPISAGSPRGPSPRSGRGGGLKWPHRPTRSRGCG